MKSKTRPLFWIVIIGVFLLLTQGTFLYAYRLAGDGWVFAGFLQNPLDGQTYLAKMAQAHAGNWRTVLPYTAEPGQSVYLFSYYIFLGHVAHWLRGSLENVFHIARGLGGLVMIGMLWRFYRATLPTLRTAKLALVWALFGSGLGWLAVPFGLIPPDFWVTEMYPFLSALTNAHFALSLGLMLFLLLPVTALHRRWFWLLAASFVLGIISPFGVVVVWIVIASQSLWPGVEKKVRNSGLVHIAWISAGSFIPIAYAAWVSITQPILAGWQQQQNLSSPMILSLLIALLPPLLLALIGGFQRSKKARVLAIWCLVGVALSQIPWGLQRRFLVGLYIPVVGLAALAAERLWERKASLAGVVIGAVVLFSLPTNVMLLAGELQAVAQHDSHLVLSADEQQALVWLDAHAPEDALVLASPQMGNFIPARINRRVIYGHPLETVPAEAEKQAVEKFYAGDWNSIQSEQFLRARGVSFVFSGPRERLLGDYSPSGGLCLAYRNATVQVFAVEQDFCHEK